MNASVRLSTVDLPTLFSHIQRASVGFESVFDRLNQSAANIANAGNYPPHNIVKLSDTSYTIELAAAGFKESELEINVEHNVLSITGNQDREGREYVHHGISNKSFEKVFNLADHAIVRDAVFSDGLLSISVEIVIPEELKPRKISIAVK